MVSQQASRLGASSRTQEESNVTTAADTSSLSLDRFWSLPEELRSRIVKLACSSTTYSSSGATMTSVDVPTARALALSRSFSQQANATLWKAIKITRPTALISLWEAVATRPELGLRIQNLYVGGVSNTAKLYHTQHWQNDMVEVYLNDDPLQPCTCAEFRCAEGRVGTRTRSTPLKRRTICKGDRFCFLQAIPRALQRIQQALHVDLRQPLAPSSGSKLYEAQAAHDLYVRHLREVENAAPCRPQCEHRDCFRYPSLVLAGFDSNTSAAPITRQEHFDPNDHEWVLTRDQILDFLCRPGRQQDSFGHPLRLDCSHFDSTSLKAVGGPFARQRPLGRHGEEDDGETFSELSQEGQLVRLPLYDGTSLSAVQCLLALTPRLKNLALTDSVLCALDGAAAVRPKSLRTLSLGPGGEWGDPSNVKLQFGDIKEIKRLHLCGFPPWPDSVANVDGLDQLMEIRWTSTWNLVLQEQICLGVILDALIGRQGTSADAAAAALLAAMERGVWHGQDRGSLRRLAMLRACSFNASAPSAPAENDIPNGSRPAAERLVEVKLLPAAYQAMLQRADSAAEHAAWLAGRSMHHQGRRLLLTVGSVPQGAAGDKPWRKWEYEEVRLWWERHCSL